MKTKILQEFLDSSIKIKSLEKLEQYINYCILNNQEEKIKGKSSHHHILPNKLFETYSNLNENPWNGSHLLYSKHYKAHFYLTEAIEDYGQSHAFICMHNMDVVNNRITESDLIPEDEFQLKMEERSKKQKDWIKTNPELSEQKNKNMIKTKSTTYIDEYGHETSIAKEANKKRISTVKKEGTFKGPNNPRSKWILIFDNNDILVFECKGNFKTICIENKMPYVTFKKSLKDKEKIYNKSRESDIMKLNASGNIKYKGWYCKYK